MGGVAGSEGAIYHTIMFDVEKFCNLTLASDKYIVPVAKGEVTFPKVVQNEQLAAAVEKLAGFVTDKTGHHSLIAEGCIYEIMGLLGFGLQNSGSNLRREVCFLDFLRTYQFFVL